MDADNASVEFSVASFLARARSFAFAIARALASALLSSVSLISDASVLGLVLVTLSASLLWASACNFS